MHQPVSLNTVVAVSADQVSDTISGEWVILGLTRGNYYGVEGVGARIWSLLQQPRAIRDVRDVLVTEYDVDADTCGRDVVAFLDELVAEGLIEVKEGESSIATPSGAESACDPPARPGEPS